MDDLIRFYTLPTVCHTHFKNSTATMNSVLHNLVCSVRTVRRVNKVSKHGEPLPMLLDWEPLPSPPLPSPPQTNKQTNPSFGASLLQGDRGCPAVAVHLDRGLGPLTREHTTVGGCFLARTLRDTRDDNGQPRGSSSESGCRCTTAAQLASERADGMAWHGMAWRVLLTTGSP